MNQICFLTTTKKIDRKRKGHLSKMKYYLLTIVGSCFLKINKVQHQTDKTLGQKDMYLRFFLLQHNISYFFLFYHLPLLSFIHQLLLYTQMATTTAIVLFILMILSLIWAWKILNWLWLKPKKLEKFLREQGLKGNSYRLLVGDIRDLLKMRKEATSKPMNLSDDIAPRVFSYFHHSVAKYGMSLLVCIIFDYYSIFP